MPRISAYSLTREPDWVIRTYLDFMDRAGVEELIMFFDGGRSPGVAEMLRDRPPGGARIIAEDLDDAYWRAAIGDPPLMRDKFVHCIARAHEMCGGDWLWVGDADEFPEDLAVMFAALDAVPAEVEAVTVPPAEAVWGPGEADAPPFATSVFRLTTPPRQWGWRLLKRLIYGRWHVFFDRNMLSHKSGKQFGRRGARVDQIDVHHTRRGGAVINRPLAEVVRLPRVLHVRHYDAISHERWLAKMRRSAEKGEEANSSQRPARLAQIALVRDLLARMDAAPDPEAAREIGARAFRRLYHLTRLQFALLRLIGGVVRLEPAVTAADAPAPPR